MTPAGAVPGQVARVAKHFNEDKRVLDNQQALLACFERFCEKDKQELRHELNSYERRLLKEGTLVKARLSHRQRYGTRGRKPNQPGGALRAI